jgi:ribosomal protein L11 methylase PrmA
MLLKGKLGLAPIETPQEALDLGTGTGIWAIDFGKPTAAHIHPAPDYDKEYLTS